MICVNSMQRAVYTVAIAMGIVAIVAAANVPAQETSAAKSSPEALSMYADAANYQNKGAFELAADEWERFLKRFPQDPLAAKAQHYLGVCQLQRQKFDAAAKAFRKVVTQYPKFEQLEDAYLNLGWCQYSLAGSSGDQARYQQAADTFAQLVEKYPKGKYVDQALFFQGESLYAMGKKKDASMAYGKLVTQHKESKLLCDALYAMGVALEEAAEYKFAARAYDEFLANCGDSDLVTEVRMRKAETTLQLGDVATAEEMFAQAASVEGFASADHALSRQAYCAARQEKFAEAGQLYGDLLERFPQSTYVPAARMSAGRAYYRAGRSEEAAKWLDQVIQEGDADAAEAAHWRSRIHLQAGEAAAAATLTEKMIPAATDSPYLPNLKLDHADALFEQADRRGDALEEYLAVRQSYPDHPVASQALYNGAFAALELRQMDKAIALCGEFRRAFADNALVPDAAYVEAESYLQKKDYPKAQAIYAELVAQYPDRDDVAAWRVRGGLCQYLQKDYEGVLQTLTPIVKDLKPPATQAEAQYWIGASQFALNQNSAAKASLESSLATDPQGARADEAWLYLARTQLKLNESEAARQSIETLQREFPSSGVLDQATYQLGEIAYAQGDFTKAIAAYDQVIAKWPDSDYGAYALYGKGWALLKLAEYKPAAESFTALIEGHPDHRLSADACFARGMCRRQTGQLDEALQDIQRFLESDPTDSQKADALYEKGLAEVAAKKYEQAVQTFEGLLKDQPENADADRVLYELAWAYSSSGDASRAATTFARLAEQHPESPLASEASFHVGEQAYNKKDFQQAVAAYSKAQSRCENEALVEKLGYKLGWSYFQLKQYDRSLEQFKQQIDGFPGGALAADALFMKGECLFQLKKYDEALPVLLAASSNEASSPLIAVLTALHGGQAAGQLGKWQQSLELLQPIPEQFPDSPYLPEARYEMGRAKQKLGRVDEALEDYRWAADRSRSAVGARAQFMAGEILFGNKQYDEAIKDFQRVMFRYGDENVPDDIRTWQAKAGYEAGRCSEVRISSAKNATERAQRIADAKKMYTYVVEQHAGHELAAEAAKRLQALKKL